MNNSPFDAVARSSRNRRLRAGLLAAALVGTGVFTWFMTRSRPTAPVPASGHVHDGTQADRARPVMLTADQSHRRHVRRGPWGRSSGRCAPWRR